MLQRKNVGPPVLENVRWSGSIPRAQVAEECASRILHRAEEARGKRTGARWKITSKYEKKIKIKMKIQKKKAARPRDRHNSWHCWLVGPP